MITLITAVTSAPATNSPKLRSTTSTGLPKSTTECFEPANTTPENRALMNDRGTTTIATMRRSLDALAL